MQRVLPEYIILAEKQRTDLKVFHPGYLEDEAFGDNRIETNHKLVIEGDTGDTDEYVTELKEKAAEKPGALCGDRSLVEKLRDRADEVIVNKYSWQDVAAATCRIYQW